jgi:hypothetical protein
MKNLADEAEHILRNNMFLPGDGYGGCRSEHGLVHIFGKYQKRTHTQRNEGEIFGQEIVERRPGIVFPRGSR